MVRFRDGIAGTGDFEGDFKVKAGSGSVLLAFAEGTVRIDGLDAGLVDASDFVFA